MAKVLREGPEFTAQNPHKKGGQPVLVTPVLGNTRGFLSLTIIYPEDHLCICQLSHSF